MDKLIMKDYSLLKVFGILLVILFHSTRQYTEGWIYTSGVQSNFFRYLNVYIYSFTMPIFVFASGAVYNYANITMKRYNNTNKFVINKLKRLLAPYFFSGIFYMVPIRIMINFYKGRDFKDIIFKDILLSKDAGHLWFLLMLFILFIVFRIIEKWINKNVFLVNVAIFCLLNFISDKLPNIFQAANVSYYLIFFYIGYIFHKNRSKAIDKCSKVKYLFCYTFLCQNFIFNLLNLSKAYINKPSVIIKVMYRVLNFANPILGIMTCYLLMIYIINKYEKIVNSKAFKILYKYNMYIYILHEPLIFIILSHLINKNISPILLVNICFWISLMLSILLSIIISRNKLLKVLFGEK